MSGYLHPLYAESLCGFGTPRELPGSKGIILERLIPRSDDFDAMGCYPIFACRNWSLLRSDLESIHAGPVSLSLVADPFGDYDIAYLRECFPDVVVPFKQHFVVDLRRPLDSFVHPHHRRNTRRALGKLQVEICAQPENFLEEWMALYATLIDRHKISGIAAFSRESFVKQLAVPGMVMFRAIHDDATVGMLLWYEQGDRAYYHLGAYSPLGYELEASFALFDVSIRYFAERHLQWLSLGAGAGTGLGTQQATGLDRFKQGWSTGTRTAYFCGRIFDRKKYQELTKNVPPTEYFPTYRVGEFN